MSNFWHWFVIVGTVGSLIGMMALLFGNRKTSGEKTTGHTWDGIEELDNPLPMWWVGLFVGTTLFAVPFLLFYPGLGNFAGLGGWSAASEHDTAVQRSKERFAPLYAELGAMTEQQLHADPRSRQVGRRLFINHCATCHGVNADGSFGFPNLTDNAWIWGSEFTTIKQTISAGRNAVMPPWQAALGDTGIQDVTQHVLSLSGNAADSDSAQAGAAQFAVFCVACHAVDGTGNQLLGAPDLTDDDWLYGGSAEQIAFTLTHGRIGNMPAQAELLDADQIHVLTGFVTSLSKSETEQSTAAAAD